jgi:hypothetical protein
MLDLVTLYGYLIVYSMLVQSQSDTYLNFINSMQSDVTKKIYEYNLRLFVEFCSVDKYENLIGQETKIIPSLMSLREKKLFLTRSQLG